MSIEPLKDLFAKSGLKFTNQRYLVYTVMRKARDHPSAEMIWQRVRDEAPAISLDTVYRTLAAFETRGLVMRVPGDGEGGRFDGNTTPHHHLICFVCGSIEDFSMSGVGLADLPPTVAAWGQVRDVQIIGRGICRQCLACMESTQPDVHNQRSTMMSKTMENLQEAFAGESQANRKYLAFAAQAEKEGHIGVAKLFKAAAAAETVHAHTHLRNMKGIGSTAENLKAAIAGETHEFTKMYPGMIETAKAEGDKTAERGFTFANAVEELHANLYSKAAEDIAGYPDKDWYVCSVCGYTVAGAAPDKCPVCQALAKAFFKVD